MLCIFVILFSYPCIVLSNPSFTKLPLPTGAESYAFDSSWGGPYASILDGRILKYQGPEDGFVEFAITVPNRSKEVCDGTYNLAVLGDKCGRPVGLGFNKATGDMYIADSYRGLLVVGRNGGLATQLATTADGVPFRFLNGLDVDELTGDVYFTEVSTAFLASEVPEVIAANDSTGRLLKYDPKTEQITVLLKNLSGASGTAVSADGMFVLVTEYIGKRIQRYWLKGPKANTAETFPNFYGRPAKVTRSAQGEFWVAGNLDKLLTNATTPTAIRLDANGKVLKIFSLVDEYDTTLISEVQEFGGDLYISSKSTEFVGVYKHEGVMN